MDTSVYKYRRHFALKKNPWIEDNIDDSSWVLSLSDLMSLLLIFFLVWTTIKISQTVPQNSRLKSSVQADTSRIKGLLMDFAPVEANGNIMVVLDGEILFNSGSHKITAEGKSLLNRIARLLKKNPRFNLKIIGHTDNVKLVKDSPWKSNLELSLARGSSVAAFLVSLGIPSDRVFVQGEGEFFPKVKNSDRIHRSFNRRVELIIEPY